MYKKIGFSKKLLALIVALAMIVSMGVFAMADTALPELVYGNENNVSFNVTEGYDGSSVTVYPVCSASFELTDLGLYTYGGYPDYPDNLPDYIGWSIGADQSITFELLADPVGNTLPAGYYEWWFMPDLTGDVSFSGAEGSGCIHVGVSVLDDGPILQSDVVICASYPYHTLTFTAGDEDTITAEIIAYESDTYAPREVYSADVCYVNDDPDDESREYLSWDSSGGVITFTISSELPEGDYCWEFRPCNFDVEGLDTTCGGFYTEPFEICVHVIPDTPPEGVVIGPADAINELYLETGKACEFWVEITAYDWDAFEPLEVNSADVCYVNDDPDDWSREHLSWYSDGNGIIFTVSPGLTAGDYVWEFDISYYDVEDLGSQSVTLYGLVIVAHVQDGQYGLYAVFDPNCQTFFSTEGSTETFTQTFTASAYYNDVGSPEDDVHITDYVVSVEQVTAPDYTPVTGVDAIRYIDVSITGADTLTVTVDGSAPAGAYTWKITPTVYGGNELCYVSPIPIGLIVSESGGGPDVDISYDPQSEYELKAEAGYGYIGPVTVHATAVDEIEGDLLPVSIGQAITVSDAGVAQASFSNYILCAAGDEDGTFEISLLPGLPVGSYTFAIDPEMYCDGQSVNAPVFMLNVTITDVDPKGIAWETVSPNIVMITSAEGSMGALSGPISVTSYNSENAIVDVDCVGISFMDAGPMGDTLYRDYLDCVSVGGNVIFLRLLPGIPAGTYNWIVAPVLDTDRTYSRVGFVVSATVTAGSDPGLITISDIHQQGSAVYLGWNADAAADSYRIYKKPAGGSWTVLASGVTGLSYVDNDVTAGTKYYYKVRGGKNGSYPSLAGETSSSITVQAPEPAITISGQPQNVTTPAGNMATFTVEAYGVNQQNLTYLWRYSSNGTYWADATKFAGYDTPTISVKALDSRDGMYVKCVISDAQGNTVESDPAQLHIGTPQSTITITQDPVDVTTTVNNTITYTVAAQGSPNAQLSYKWEYSAHGTFWADATKFAGYDTPTISVKAIESRDQMYFRCVVSDNLGNSETSEAARLYIGAPSTAITITQNPVDVTTTANNTITYTVAAQGSPNAQLSYKWEYSGSGVSWADATKFTGYNTPTISVKALESRDGMYFRCVVSDNLGNSETSEAARLYIGAPSAAISITQNPEDVTTTAGSMASFTVTAESATDQTLSYLWQYSSNGNFWADATKFAGYDTDTITIKALDSRDGMYVRCTVSDPYGNTETCDPAQLHIGTPQSTITITQDPVDVTTTAGSMASFTVTAESATDQTLSYLWQYSSNGNFWADATKFAGYDTDTITIKALDSRDGMYVRCTVSDPYGNTETCDPAQLHIGIPQSTITITQDPVDVTTTVNNTITYTVAAQGSPNAQLSYKWEYSAHGTFWADATKFAGYDTPTISVKALESRDQMYFRCVVSDNLGNTVTSDPAQLHIGTPQSAITITQDPVDITTTVNNTVNFTVAAQGSPNAQLSYKWEYSAHGTFWADATKFAGYDTPTISVKAIESRDQMYFRCVVSDNLGNSETSDPAQLHIAAPQSAITITQDPVDITTTVNNTVNFTVAAQGSPNAQLSYKWEYSGSGVSWADATKFAGYNTPTISVKALESRYGMYVRCVVSDNLGNSETSKAARLYIGAPSAAISITQNPEDVTTTAGSMASFTVTAESATDQTLSYLWQYSSNGNFWADATKFAGYDTDTITIKALDSRDGMYVRCTVSDPYGNTETCDPAQLFIAAAPAN